MPAYVLKRTWHTDVFYRTIETAGGRRRLVFRKKDPVELTDEELAAVQAAGTAPIEQLRISSASVAPGDTAAAAKRPKKGK